MKKTVSAKKEYTDFFSNLSNELKIRIILCLKTGQKNVKGICDCLGTEQSKISHALASLRCTGIVKVKQKGKERIYSLNKDTILPILNLADKHVSNFEMEKC